MERAVHESEARFRRTFENAAVGMILTDVAGRFLEYNRRFCEFLDYSAEALAGRCFSSSWIRRSRVTSRAPATRRAGETPAFTRDARYFQKDGAVVWGNLTLSSFNATRTARRRT